MNNPNNNLDKIYQELGHNTATLKRFIDCIKIKDQASKKKLSEVVPEWAPYFE
jgi:hypothetical protein